MESLSAFLAMVAVVTVALEVKRNFFFALERAYGVNSLGTRNMKVFGFLGNKRHSSQIPCCSAIWWKLLMLKLYKNTCRWREKENHASAGFLLCYNKIMFNKHLVKVLLGFIGVIVAGLIFLVIIDSFK